MPRVSRHIRVRVASNLHHAIRIAEAIGLPLNTFVTINYSETGCEVEEVSASFAFLRNTRYSHWTRRPGVRSKATPCQPTHIWVIEAAGGVIAAHWLIHIPAGRRKDFETKLTKWLTDTAGPISFKDAVEVKEARTPRSAGRYMLKGMDKAHASRFGIVHADQGEVHGRRSGYSANLGPTAKRTLREAGKYRKAKAWKPLPPHPPSAGM